MINEYSIQKGGYPTLGEVIGYGILLFIISWSIIQCARGCIFFKGGPFL